ncbi:MAG: ABC transporter permease [Myxococcales bacterium]|nr:ABC transporter permease [Myxococcales bacterium]
MRRVLRVLRVLWSRRGTRVALIVSALLLVCGLGAEFLASDLPIAVKFRGEVYLLPNIARPAALRAFDNNTLSSHQDVAWIVRPLCRWGPSQTDLAKAPPAKPGGTHWLGTDDRGRDVFARVVHGTRAALVVGVGSVVLATAIGVLLGLLGGYFGGRVDFVVGRLTELGLAFPSFFLILAAVAMLGGVSLTAIVLVFGLTRWMSIARLVRAEVLHLRELDFILAVRALGASTPRVIFVHLLPATLRPAIVSATLGVSVAILTEGGLSFLGFGVPPPMASWGEILGQAYDHQGAWWLILFPGLALTVTVLAINAIGEGLRPALDPRTR